MSCVGMPASMKLEQFGRLLYEAFGHRAYHVGSSLFKHEWRDIDVRLILPDDEFGRVCGPLTRPRCANPMWNALCLAFSALGRDMTGLPIDFQIDQMTQANVEFPGNRSALGCMPEVWAHVQAAEPPVEEETT